MNGHCLSCQCEWILLRVPPLALTSCIPSFPLSLSLLPSTESVRAKLHLGALQPLCLSGWFTLHWPGLGLPGPHYQLPATGTHCFWQTQGRGTLHITFLQWKKGLRREVFPQPQPRLLIPTQFMHSGGQTEKHPFLPWIIVSACFEVLSVWLCAGEYSLG